MQSDNRPRTIRRRRSFSRLHIVEDRSMYRIFGYALLMLILLYGCKESPVGVDMHSLLPTLRVFKPATNDTISYGIHEVIYDVDNTRGIVRYEVVVNDSLATRVQTPPDSARPALFWVVDSSLVSSRKQYYVRAFDVDGNMIRSGTMSNILIGVDISPPAPPKNLTLMRITQSSINLMWEDSSPNEDVFEVWRKQGSDPYQLCMTLPRNAISANDTGLSPSVAYKYKVRAVNQYGFGESNEVSTGTDSTTTVVPAPSALSATALGTRAVELTWTDNSSNELLFIIERRVASGTNYSRIAVVSPNQTSYVDTAGLFGGSSYTYRVAAQGQFRQSAWSNEATVLTMYQDINPPSNLRASYVPSGRRIVLTWSDNSILERETHIERMVDSSGVFVEIGNTGVDIATFVDSTLEIGHTYSYRVRVSTIDNLYSLYSNIATAEVPLASVMPSRQLPAGRATRQTCGRSGYCGEIGSSTLRKFMG